MHCVDYAHSTNNSEKNVYAPIRRRHVHKRVFGVSRATHSSSLHFALVWRYPWCMDGLSAIFPTRALGGVSLRPSARQALPNTPPGDYSWRLPNPFAVFASDNTRTPRLSSQCAANPRNPSGLNGFCGYSLHALVGVRTLIATLVRRCSSRPIAVSFIRTVKWRLTSGVVELPVFDRTCPHAVNANLDMVVCIPCLYGGDALVRVASSRA